MTIHAAHPFIDPERVEARQFRGRLGARVSLFTTGALEKGAGTAAAGLTVSSFMVAGGEPWRVLALLDPDAALTEALSDTEVAVISLLDWPHRHLADAFAGLAPAPGGAFKLAEFTQTEWGPRLVDADSWAGVRLESMQDVGWSSLVTLRIEQVHAADDRAPLHHVRGRYLAPLGEG